MFRLYIRFYFALVASLALFAMATLVVWHLTGVPMQHAGAILGKVMQNALAPADSPPAVQQEALQHLAAGISADVTLFDAKGLRIASVGRPLSAPVAKRRAFMGFSWRMGPATFVRLADGRLLVSNVAIGYPNPLGAFHLLLLILTVAIVVGALPVVRQITRRLERLQRGVESLGAGDFAARVKVEGRDEVAQLAAAFNRSAGQIEQLVGAHKSLLANASHELRTPLARIRLALELSTQSVDPGRRAGLEQDIAELDGLVDEILLASRLDTVPGSFVKEDVDLLALTAEECARFENVHLEGTPVVVRGDARLLRRMVRNLLENARRHGAPPTEVRVARAGSDATLTVWDNGPGVLPAEFENVFRPFYRPNQSSSGGTGLGLSLVRQIARLHGGEARCQLLEGPQTSQRSGFVVSFAV
jgi:signal transduction histidine kinase